MLVFILELLFLVTLGAIVFEDFAERRIHLFLFLIGYILTVILTLKKGMNIEFLIVNFLFVVINIVAILGYCHIKKLEIKVASEWVGLGDLLMWGMLIFYFSPINFIIFFIISLFFSLLTFFLFFKKKNALLPLAGNQALCLFIVLLGNLSGMELSLYSDDFFMIRF